MAANLRLWQHALCSIYAKPTIRRRRKWPTTNTHATAAMRLHAQRIVYFHCLFRFFDTFCSHLSTKTGGQIRRFRDSEILDIFWWQIVMLCNTNTITSKCINFGLYVLLYMCYMVIINSIVLKYFEIVDYC